MHEKAAGWQDIASVAEEIRSTGREALELVNDVSDPDELELRAQVEMVLEEIGASDVPVIYVNNKIDLIGDEPRIRRNEQGFIDRVWVSAESGEGVDLIQKAVADFLSSHHKEHKLILKPQAGALRAKLYQRCEVVSEIVDEQGNICLLVKMDAADKGWLDARTQFSDLWHEIR